MNSYIHTGLFKYTHSLTVMNANADTISNIFQRFPYCGYGYVVIKGAGCGYISKSQGNQEKTC